LKGVPYLVASRWDALKGVPYVAVVRGVRLERTSHITTPANNRVAFAGAVSSAAASSAAPSRPSTITTSPTPLVSACSHARSFAIIPAVAVFPLKKNEGPLVESAKNIRGELRQAGLRVVYDDTGAIGKLYRRQDEIGTPWCITVDFQTLQDGTVTVRDRDTMKQERVPAKELAVALSVRMR